MTELNPELNPDSTPQFSQDFDHENASRDSPQFGFILVRIFLAFAVFLLIPILLVIKLRATPQSNATPASPPAATPVAASIAPVAGSILWETSYESAMETARQSGKPLMINFYTDWCGVCKQLDANTFPAGEVIAESQNFVNVKINAEVRTDLARQYGVHSYPTILFLDANGNTLNRFAGGYASAGFVKQMQSARSQVG